MDRADVNVLAESCSQRLPSVLPSAAQDAARYTSAGYVAPYRISFSYVSVDAWFVDGSNGAAVAEAERILQVGAQASCSRGDRLPADGRRGGRRGGRVGLGAWARPSPLYPFMKSHDASPCACRLQWVSQGGGLIIGGTAYWAGLDTLAGESINKLLYPKTGLISDHLSRSKDYAPDPVNPPFQVTYTRQGP